MTSTPRPRLPIGVSDFRVLREAGMLYVDKTDFVTQVLDSGAAVVLLPRPRRFGKTLNLSTVRYFVEKSEEDRTALFEGLSVSRSESARPHFQRYPVISLTFKDVKEGSFDAAFAAIRREVARAYHEHAYLREGQLSPEHAAKFQQILSAEGPTDLYAESLRELSTYLARHHDKRVVILIDDYDTPSYVARPHEDDSRLLGFLRSFLSGGLKDNVHLFKGVMTGSLRIAEENLFAGLNNLAVYSLLRTEYSTCFGFTEAEVRDLAERTGCAASFADIESWYNGYRFGGHTIYNPWSVLNFLASEDKVLRPYWVQASFNDLLERTVLDQGGAQHAELEDLLAGKEITKFIHESVAPRDLKKNPDTLWSFLLFTGYLKATKVVEDENGMHATLAIVNREVRHVYRTIVRSRLAQVKVAVASPREGGGKRVSPARARAGRPTRGRIERGTSGGGRRR